MARIDVITVHVATHVHGALLRAAPCLSSPVQLVGVQKTASPFMAVPQPSSAVKMDVVLNLLRNVRTTIAQCPRSPSSPIRVLMALTSVLTGLVSRDRHLLARMRYSPFLACFAHLQPYFVLSPAYFEFALSATSTDDRFVIASPLNTNTAQRALIRTESPNGTGQQLFVVYESAPWSELRQITPFAAWRVKPLSVLGRSGFENNIFSPVIDVRVTSTNSLSSSLPFFTAQRMHRCRPCRSISSLPPSSIVS